MHKLLTKISFFIFLMYGLGGGYNEVIADFKHSTVRN